MAKLDQKKAKIICPSCRGNGFIRVPYEIAKEEVHAQCETCDSEGEINADKADDVIIDTDGVHRLQ